MKRNEEERPKTYDFLKVVEGIKKEKEVSEKEAFKALRKFYLELLEAEFSMEEAMSFLAAICNQAKGSQDGI